MQKINRRETIAKMAVDHCCGTRGGRTFVLLREAIPRCRESGAQSAGSRRALRRLGGLLGLCSVAKIMFQQAAQAGAAADIAHRNQVGLPLSFLGLQWNLWVNVRR